ncbi:MAG: AsmA-like C-terminal region-containing protein [Candidatus Omnitrophota bacterium]
MKKFISKPLLISASITFFILIFFSFSFFAKMYLVANKEKIEKKISNYFGKQVSIARIHYAPPGFIILEDVTILDNKDKKYPPLSIQRIMLAFSIKEFLNNKNLVINKIYFTKPKIDADQYPLFLKENIQKIVEFINILSRGRPLKIIIEDALLVKKRVGNKINAIIMNLKIQVGKQQHVESSGQIKICKINEEIFSEKLQLENIDTPALIYQFQGLIVPEGAIIDNIYIEYSGLNARLRGQLKRSMLELKGYSTLENFFDKTLINKSSKAEIVKKIKQLILYQRIPQKLGIGTGGVDIVDIDCQIKFTSKKAVLEKLNCFVQNIPVNLTGEISFEPETAFNVNVSTFPDQKDTLRKENPQRLNFLLNCKIKENKFSGDLEAAFSRIANKKIIEQNFRMNFHKAVLGLSTEERFKLFIEKLTILYNWGKNNHSFLLKNCDSILNFQNKDIKFIKFNSQIFDGKISGYGLINLAYQPLKISSDLKVSDVSANELDSILFSLFGEYQRLPAKLPGRIYGNFNGNLSYTNYPAYRLKGAIAIKNGYLNNVSFFVWLSEFFKIPDLEKIDFNNIYTEFKISDQNSLFNEVRLESEKIFLRAEFNLNQNEFISSRISLTLPRQLLATSAKFQLLLSLISADIDKFTFKFQLSGLYNSINFKWLESDFKQKVKEMLPGFIERGIERKIEKAIKSIAAPAEKIL